MPTSQLPPAYEPRHCQEKWYSWWEERGYFHADAEPGRPSYCITIPPPNVTGELHMGHAIQHAIHDAVVRWKRMQGYQTLCLPGTDHAGIATQMKVEQQIGQQEGKNRWEVGREEMLRRIWAWTEQYGGTILRQLRALGCSYDWRRTRFTLDEAYARAVLEAFVHFYRRGWIYRGKRMVNWCPSCRTVISDLEVEEVSHQGSLWYLRYPLWGEQGEVVVATTRPETMLGDTAVAVHPEDVRWKPLVGKQVLLPLMDRLIPIVADEYADPAMGSGAVKVTPAHDPNDFEIGLRHDLPQVQVIGEDGHMSQEAGRFAGLERFRARQVVLDELREGGYLVRTEKYEHSVPTHDKCGTVIEPLAKEQWWMSMRELAHQAMPVLQEAQVQYFPDRFRSYSIDWLSNLRDWCLSRQLWWGHRIPVWTCSGCGELSVQVDPPVTCGHCGGSDLQQDPDVLDTWFSSALWPFVTLGWPEKTPDLACFYPTDLLITARDILYLWVVRMIMTSIELMHDIPFRHVFVHPTILTKDGRRMSKSLGTGLDPLELIELYGTDATRFALLYQCSSTQDVRFDAEVQENKIRRSQTLEMCRNFANKVWNAGRFVLMNASDPDRPVKREDLPPREEREIVDRWFLHRLDETIGAVTRALQEYRLDEYARTLYEFVWSEFCDWYLEMAKPRLYEGNPQQQETVRRILLYGLDQLLRLLHPAMPFLTEELWQTLPHEEESLMVAPWPTADPPLRDEQAVEEMAVLMETVRAVRHLRSEAGLQDQRVRIVAHIHDAAVGQALARNDRYLRFLGRVETWEQRAAHSERPRCSLTAVVQGADLFLPLEGLVDLHQERKRIQKEIEELHRQLGRSEAKLRSNDFITKAPAEVVERERQRRDELQDRHQRLTTRLRTLTEATD